MKITAVTAVTKSKTKGTVLGVFFLNLLFPSWDVIMNNKVSSVIREIRLCGITHKSQQ